VATIPDVTQRKCCCAVPDVLERQIADSARVVALLGCEGLNVQMSWFWSAPGAACGPAASPPIRTVGGAGAPAAVFAAWAGGVAALGLLGGGCAGRGLWAGGGP